MTHTTPESIAAASHTEQASSASSSTYAPTLMYIGGMHVTDRPTKQPSRIDDPPGTIRTPLSAANCFTG